MNLRRIASRIAAFKIAIDPHLLHIREGLRNEDAMNYISNTEKSLLEKKIDENEAVEKIVDFLIQVSDPVNFLNSIGPRPKTNDRPSKPAKFPALPHEDIKKALEERMRQGKKESEEYDFTKLMESPEVHDPESAKKYLEENYEELGYDSYKEAFDELYSTMIEPYYRGLAKGGVEYVPDTISEVIALNNRKSDSEKLKALNKWVEEHEPKVENQTPKNFKSFTQLLSNSLVGKSNTDIRTILKGYELEPDTFVGIRNRFFPTMLPQRSSRR